VQATAKISIFSVLNWLDYTILEFESVIHTEISQAGALPNNCNLVPKV
jgi:hypothetical protein